MILAMIMIPFMQEQLNTDDGKSKSELENLQNELNKPKRLRNSNVYPLHQWTILNVSLI